MVSVLLVVVESAVLWEIAIASEEFTELRCGKSRGQKITESLTPVIKKTKQNTLMDSRPS